ncbi:MAG: four helix bundle protein [Candidatus Marinimicrobia bacterium]|nr:four helix bundle protein [Candidatus Neomarinimicrobiota bacterium]
MVVATNIFDLTEHLPRTEDYGFTSQIRRAAPSISANIAEAFGRNHIADKINFYYYARGSAMETQSHLEYGKRVKYLAPEGVNKMDIQIRNLIHGINQIIVTLKSKTKSKP